MKIFLLNKSLILKIHLEREYYHKNSMFDLVLFAFFLPVYNL